MRNFIVNVFNFLQKPVSVSLWWLALLLLTFFSDLLGQVREGGFNWGALTVVILVMIAGDWILGYLRKESNGGK